MADDLYRVTQADLPKLFGSRTIPEALQATDKNLKGGLRMHGALSPDPEGGYLFVVEAEIWDAECPTNLGKETIHLTESPSFLERIEA